MGRDVLSSEATCEAKWAPPPLLVEQASAPNVRGLASHEGGHVVREAAGGAKGALRPLLHTVTELLRGRGRLHVGAVLVLATPLLGRGWGIIRRVARIQLFSLTHIPMSRPVMDPAVTPCTVLEATAAPSDERRWVQTKCLVVSLYSWVKALHNSVLHLYSLTGIHAGGHKCLDIGAPS